MRCRQWDCEYCSTKNADMWRAHLLETFLNVMCDKRWVFITLTAPPWSHKKPQKSLQVLKQAWGKMYDKLRYKNGGALSYVLVYETHKSGAYHVHALVDMGDIYDGHGVIIDYSLPHEEKIKAEKAHPFCVWLKDKATNSKAGWVCHATRIHEGETGKDNARLAVGYVTKYFTKGARDMPMPKRWRRICTSRDVGSPRTKSKKGFEWRMIRYVTPRDVAHTPHFLVSENRVLDASDFGDEGVYPDNA